MDFGSSYYTPMPRDMEVIFPLQFKSKLYRFLRNSPDNPYVSWQFCAFFSGFRDFAQGILHEFTEFVLSAT
jgi:hypothetical protein